MTAGEVMTDARTYLNDQSAGLFTDAVLLPVLNTVWKEVQLRLRETNSPHVREVNTSPIDVLANATSVASLPTDLYYPGRIYERPDGGTAQQWEPVVQRFSLDLTVPAGDRIYYYEWTEGSIKLSPATTNRELLIYYTKALAVFSTSGSTFPIPDLSSPTALFLASLAAESIGKDPDLAKYLLIKAERAFNMYRNTEVHTAQALPMRRKPWSPYRY